MTDFLHLEIKLEACFLHQAPFLRWSWQTGRTDINQSYCKRKKWKMMGSYTNTLGDRLTNLMKKNYDAEKGFKKAAKNVKLAKLKSYFMDKAQERHDFGDQLKSELEHFVEKTDKPMVHKNTVFPTWIDINSWFFEDDRSMFQEAIKGEVISIEEYNDVLKSKTLPYAVKELLKIQKHTIEHSLVNIKRLEDLF